MAEVLSIGARCSFCGIRQDDPKIQELIATPNDIGRGVYLRPMCGCVRNLQRAGTPVQRKAETTEEIPMPKNTTDL
jgi:hypothetical protein